MTDAASSTLSAVRRTMRLMLSFGAVVLFVLAWPMVAEAQFGALERLVMPGPVAAAHAQYETTCAACHVRFERQSQRVLCLDCHEEVAEDLATGTGFHSLSPDVGSRECARCHTEHKGRDADILGFDASAFDHGLTDFALRGRHVELACTDCHAREATYHAAETECRACHADDDRHRGNLGGACADCHSETAWTDVRFDHTVVTGYALTGAHAPLACTSCHVEERYEATPAACVDCHRDDDTHMGRNGPECRDCHTTENWTHPSFDHFVRTSFALAGGHAGLTCESCHASGAFAAAAPTECSGCHADDDAHRGVNGPACNDCHRVTTWLDVTFDHARDADFALVGAHGQVSCDGCHVEPVAVALPATDCFGCHATDDPHAGQLGVSCAGCHGEVAWTRDVRFDHDLTAFPLLGRHAAAGCDSCHATPAFHDAPGECVDCHAEQDAHGRRLGTDCGWCHTPNDWLVWHFDHDLETRFALDGAHRDLDCRACHAEPALDGAIALPGTCASCHRSDDVHRGQFGTDCARCHVTDSFRQLKVP